MGGGLRDARGARPPLQTTVTWAAEKRERASLDESDRKWPARSPPLQRGSAGPYSRGWALNAGTGMTAGGPTTCKELQGGKKKILLCSQKSLNFPRDPQTLSSVLFRDKPPEPPRPYQHQPCKSKCKFSSQVQSPAPQAASSVALGKARQVSEPCALVHEV